jgi:acetylornithine deacetylase ArgE
LELVDLAKTLISFRTEVPPGDEESCASYIRDLLADMRIPETQLVLDKFENRRANLVAKIGPREPGLLLSGHMDVVPAGDEAAWSHPPFEGEVSGGRLYGRGAADMKMGLAAMLQAIEATAKHARLRRGVMFVATAGEEVGFEGLKSLLERKLVGKGSARFGVLGEPTRLRPVRAHRGGATFKVTIWGRSGHASRPELGVNAIEKCSLFIEALSTWNKSVSVVRDPDLGATIATPTLVAGGTKSNVIPGACELTVDARSIPGRGTEFIGRGLRSIVASLKKRDEEFDARIELLYDTPSLRLAPSDPAVILAEGLSGFKAETAPYGTEAALYAKNGIPAIVLGPGDLKQAHTVDEFVRLSEARRALWIYSRMIESICVA